MNPKEIECEGVEWIERSQDKIHWQALEKQSNEPWDSVKGAEFLDYQLRGLCSTEFTENMMIT